MTEHEACYVFTPKQVKDSSERPSKRRKTGKAPGLINDDARVPFVPLLRGTEKAQSVQCRASSFSAHWQPKQTLIDETVKSTNDGIINEVVSFALEQHNFESNGKLPTGLVLASPDDSQSLDFTSIVERVNLEKRAVLVQLNSGVCPNLKSTLKYINQAATSQVLAEDEERLAEVDKSLRRLNYDLEILHDYIKDHSVPRVILALQESEAFDVALLVDLIEILSSWIDRIPFILFFSLATPIELFQSKLPRETIRRLAGAEFHVRRVETREIFRKLLHERPALFCGSALSNMLLQHQSDFIQSPAAFTSTLKYTYMTHFFANPLSILLSEQPTDAPLQKEHYEAIRNLSSFRRYAQDLIDEKRYDNVRDLLDDDESLNEVVMQELVKSRQALEGVLSALELLCALQSYNADSPDATWSEMYVKAMSGSLLESGSVKDTLHIIKKLHSNQMVDLLEQIPIIHSITPSLVENLATLSDDLNQLLKSLKNDTLPLRSAHDIQQTTLRTTIVAQKVSLSKNSAKLSSQDTAYTEIVDRIYDTLSTYFLNTLINPSDLFLNEVLIYDSKSPNREVFNPRPRFAIERALSSPHDYLGCECCGGAGLEATQPATAILYQLYLESGSLINTADLWEAFWTIVGEEDDEEGIEKGLVLFSRGLAELKYMGVIKGSKKKVDHLQKLAWKGL